MMLSNSGTPFNEHGFGLIIDDLRRLDLAQSGGSNDFNQGDESVSQENQEDTRVSYEARQLWSVPITSQLPSNGQVLTYDATSNQWGPGSIAVSGYLTAANNLSDLTNVVTARNNLVLGTGDSPQFTAVNIGDAADTTVSRASPGDIAVEGNLIYRAGGTDVPVTDGGTGASTPAGARSNLGIFTPEGFFFAYQSADQTVAHNAANVDLTMNELIDVDSCYNPATGVFTAPSTGYYYFALHTAFGAASSGVFVTSTYVYFEIQASSGAKFRSIFYPFDAGNGRTLSTAISLNAADTVKAVILSYFSDVASNGTLLGTTGSTVYLNYFYGYRVR